MKYMFFTLSFISFLAGAAQADLTVERKVKLTMKDIVGTSQRIHREERVRIKGGNVRIEDLTFGEVWIVRMDQKTLWRIDTMSRTYSEWSFDAIARRRQEVVEQIQQARKVVEKSDEERALTEILSRFAEIKDPSSLVLEEGAATESIAGVSCKSYTLKAGDQLALNAWGCDTLPEGAAYLKALAALGCFPEAVAKKFEGKPVFPMRGYFWYTWLLDRMTAEVDTTSISKDPVKDEEFALPKDYQKVPYPAFDDTPERTVKKVEVKKANSEDDPERDANPFKQQK